jgi:hypothetical protein
LRPAAGSGSDAITQLANTYAAPTFRTKNLFRVLMGRNTALYPKSMVYPEFGPHGSGSLHLLNLMSMSARLHAQREDVLLNSSGKEQSRVGRYQAVLSVEIGKALASAHIYQD